MVSLLRQSAQDSKIRVRIAPARRLQGENAAPPAPPAVSLPTDGLYVPTDTELVESPPPASRTGKCEAVAGSGPASSSPIPDGAVAGLELASDAEEAGGLRALIRQAAIGFQTRQKIEVEDYELGEMLGQGAMGVVYKAVRKLDRFPVAVKVMLARVAVQDKARKRFLREIDVIRQLSHANIVALIASGAVQNAFYFVAEYCNGGSLSALAAQQGGQLPLQVLAPIVLQSLTGLAHAHRQGFVHRDIKPANILLHQQQRGWAAKLSDFGLAKHFEQAGFSGMTLTGTVGGTYDYMPREQLTDFKDTRPVSDVWSMGATFYRVLTGASPRPSPEGRDPMEVVLREKHTPVRQRNPGVSRAVACVIDKSLALEPGDRYQDAGEMGIALEEALSQSSC